MANFIEIDFIEISAGKSGDAITARYKEGTLTTIHLIDAGYQSCSDSVVSYINEYYSNPKKIDYVTITHPDQDHIGGVIGVLESFDEIGSIWINRPWLYANELLSEFEGCKTVRELKKRLRESYPKIVEIEEFANSNSIPIYSPLQGTKIGKFIVLSPTKELYLEQVLSSNKTKHLHESLDDSLQKSASSSKPAPWGEEVFPSGDTGPENQVSVVQYLNFDGSSFVLTSDAGKKSLHAAADYAESEGITLPITGKFQVPHHGSRQNVDGDVLDRWLGEKYSDENGELRGTAIISASDNDPKHPKKVVIRACIHRGYKVITTENGSKRTGVNLPAREGWSAVVPIKYPSSMET